MYEFCLENQREGLPVEEMGQHQRKYEEYLKPSHFAFKNDQKPPKSARGHYEPRRDAVLKKEVCRHLDVS